MCVNTTSLKTTYTEISADDRAVMIAPPSLDESIQRKTLSEITMTPSPNPATQDAQPLIELENVRFSNKLFSIVISPWLENDKNE
jgi:hypothetical protein